jgi:branched-chain amino acid transport system ATP-binding protein
MSLLTIEDVAAGYGEIDIVSKMNLTVAAREIVTIAGTNGAGKSTLVKAIMGLAPRCSGRIVFDGHDLMKLDAEDRISVGISYVPQVANVFAPLTVTENLQLVESVTDQRARIQEIFDLFPALATRRRSAAGSLSGGERQQLAFARALMPKPKLILLDEPTAALSPALVLQVLKLIQTLPGLGSAALVVEQRARQSLDISDRGYILDSGRIVMSGEAKALLADEQMTKHYLGRA